MNRCLGLALLLLSGWLTLAHAFSLSALLGGSAALTGPTCGLLSDSFDGADGTNLTAAGWTADGTDCADTCELDTARQLSGASSVLIDNVTATSALTVYRSITQQTTGKFTVDFWVQFDDVAVASETGYIVALNQGAFASPTSFTVIVRRLEDDFQLFTGSTWVNQCTACLTSDTWHHVEIESDQTANTVNIWLDDSQVTTGAAFQNNLDPDRVYLRTVNGVTRANMWGDDLCVYAGARQ